MTKEILKVSEEKNVDEEVLTKILEISRRLSDSSWVKTISNSKENTIAIEGMDLIPWGNLSMSHGLPGLCLLFGELDSMNPNDGWDLVGHSLMIEIQHYIKQEGVAFTSTFSGLAGIGFAARALSRNGTRYLNFINNINAFLIEEVKARLTAIKDRMPDVYMSDYDSIEGLSGVARYLLFYQSDDEVKKTLENILEYLVEITKDIMINGQKIPGWFISRDNQFLESDKQFNPIGNFNCGMSHGIAGPMAILAISLINGVEIKGQRESIYKIASWLMDRKGIINESDFYFPPTVSWEQELNRQYSTSPSRDAWCYGSPGVSRSLFLAGKSLRNEDFIKASQQTLQSVFRRSDEEWGLDSPTFCHGLSGLLHITEIMNQSLGTNPFEKEIVRLRNMIIETYDENHPFGFQDIEKMESKVAHFNKAGLLDGATGVLLVLLSSINGKSQTDWDSLFLLN